MKEDIGRNVVPFLLISLLEVASDNFVSSKINVLESKKPLSSEHMLMINGSKTINNPITYNDIIYLPLRETCEKLNYNVDWVAQTKTVIIKKENSTIQIPTKSTKLINKNGTTFLPISSFMRYLNISVDINSNNTITIKG